MGAPNDIASATGGAAVRPGQLDQPDADELAALGISADDYRFFIDTFVGEPWSYAIRRPPGGWRLAMDRPLTARLLLRHLRGDFWIGTGARRSTKKFVARWFAIDLDFADDLAARYDAVCAALGPASLVFGSEESGGLHVYYFLDREAPLHQLRNAEGTNGAVLRVLNRAGAGERLGIEVYPRGKYAIRGTQNRLRLPHGRGWRLLDPDSLLPLVTPPSRMSDLKLVRALFDADKVRLVELDDLLRRSWNAWPTRPKVRRVNAHRAAEDEIARRESRVRDLREHGLQSAGEFNEAVAALAYDSLWNRRTKEDALADVEQWLASGLDNGRSETVNRSRKDAIAEATSVVERIYGNRQPSRWCELPGITAVDVMAIFAATTRDAAADPDTGEALSLFKLQRLAFELMRRAKQYVLTEARDVLDWVRRSRPRLVGEKLDEAAVLRMRRVWPDPARRVFVVACPYTLRATVPGVSERTLGRYWRAIKHVGLFTESGRANAQLFRCATFAVRLDFGGSGFQFMDFDHAVVALLSSAERRALYTRHHDRRLRIVQMPNIAPAPVVTEAEAFIRRSLSATGANGESAA